MKKFLKIDFIILVCTLLLVFVGVFTLYSLTLTVGEEDFKYGLYRQDFINQLVFIFVGAVAFIIIFSIPSLYFDIKLFAYFAFGLIIFLLLLTIFFGEEVREAKRWIEIGAIRIQPSEIVKVIMIFAVSQILSFGLIRSKVTRKSLVDKSIQYVKVYSYHILVLIVGLISSFLIFLQSSLTVTFVFFIVFTVIYLSSFDNKRLVLFGTSIFIIIISLLQTIFPMNEITRNVFFGILILLLVLSVILRAIDLRIMLVLVTLAFLIGVSLNAIWQSDLIKPEQKSRINPDCSTIEGERNECFQQLFSKRIIGSGRMFGEGLSSEIDDTIHSFPDTTTDFIFAIIGYKFGFIGSIIVIMIYIVLVTRLYYLSDKMEKKSDSLILIGTATMIFVQFFINLGMNVGITPVGGTTLPLISAGGSSFLSIITAIALCQNIIASNKVNNKQVSSNRIQIEGWN